MQFREQEEGEMRCCRIKKIFPLLAVMFLFFYTPSIEAEEKITWMVLDWKPWIILEGEDKGTGRFNHILKIAQDNLPEYTHETEVMNWARFWHEIENKNNVCYPFGLKKGNREKLVYYSAPHTLVLPNAIIMKKETAQLLGNPTSYSIAQILQQDRLKGYAEKDRSFTEKIDSIMKDYEQGSSLTRIPESSESLIKMVSMGRIDYTIDYPIVAAYYQKKIGRPESLISIPIVEMEPFSYVYMNCTKNEWGKKVIEKWNAVLREIKPTEEFRRVTELGHTNEDELLLIRTFYNDFIQEQY